MARYILVDNDSGYIFADSADLNGRVFAGGPVEFAEAFDHAQHEYDRTYEMIGHNPRTTEMGYHVYRADIGSEVVPVVTDGQARKMIEAVERNCAYLGFIRCSPAE